MKTWKISTLKTKKNFQKKLSYVDLLLLEEKDRKNYVLIKGSYMTIPYIVEKGIFVVIVFKLLAQKNY